jgi:peptidoglycan/xylan/chitin deacetylase (PgdA/CDA1 family)
MLKIAGVAALVGGAVVLSTSLLGSSAVGGSGSLAVPQCANPQALNTSRTIAAKPSDFPMVGKQQYMETLRLNDREVVLTFDDGPIAPNTDKVLDALAAECVKATFFMLGTNVAEAPHLARRAYDEGHTVGTHTFSHVDLSKVPLSKAKNDIDLGIAAVTEALGKNRQVAPFFRPPYLAITKDVEKFLYSRGQMVWGIDADSNDWTFATANRVVERSISELEKAGKGILLLHDIKPATARALPLLLAELKRRGFRIVHVVPATNATSAAIEPPVGAGLVR